MRNPSRSWRKSRRSQQCPQVTTTPSEGNRSPGEPKQTYPATSHPPTAESWFSNKFATRRQTLQKRRTTSKCRGIPGRERRIQRVGILVVINTAAIN